MKKYLALIKIQFKSNFCYRVSTYAGIVVGILQVFVMYYIWSEVYRNTDNIAGFDKEQIVTYFIFSTVIYRLIELGITLRVSDLVRSGEIALFVVKPINFINNLFFESVGTLATDLFTMVLPISVFCGICFNVYLQKSILSLLAFIVSMLIAVSISIYIDILFGLFTFWTENGWGLRVIRQAVVKLFSGAVIPLAFLPGWFNKLTDFLPFKSLIDTPINIYLNRFTLDTLKLMGAQLFWLVVLMILAKVLYGFIVRRLDINGG